MAKRLQLLRGTQAQNNLYVGGDGELTFDTDTKGLRIHDGSKVGGYMVDSVIAFQRPTEANNYTWYRLYASGWVEMGGCITGLTNWADRTITMPVEMGNRGYCLVISPIMNDNTGSGSWAVAVTLKTETQFTTRFYSNNGYLPSWEVKGMASETAIADILGE